MTHPTNTVLTDEEVNDLCGVIAANTTMRAENDRKLVRDAERATIEKMGASEAALEPVDWMTCETRAPWAINSLRHRAKEMRAAGKRCRNAFRKDYMGVMARYVADAFDDAARAFEARLSTIDAARQSDQQEQ